MVRTLEGGLDGTGRRVAVAASRFNRLVTDLLVAGATEALRRHGVAEADVDVAWVPGAFELPLAAAYLAETGRYAGVACLGAVIRGETDHYDYVCAEAARGIQDVQLRTGIPCSFGVLTVENMDQALARSGGDHRDTGYHAAQVVLRMAALRTELA
jgi:6,7-dimethyl-8-ribityllumazine synthase